MDVPSKRYAWALLLSRADNSNGIDILSISQNCPSWTLVRLESQAKIDDISIRLALLRLFPFLS